MEYQLIIPPAELTNPNLNEFYGVVQKSIVEGKKSHNVKDLQQYIQEYKYKTIVVKK
jgi:hydroxymethylpyrimidine/phosphomethylpyrimidine kinase